jgi:hypothetical protein
LITNLGALIINNIPVVGTRGGSRTARVGGGTLFANTQGYYVRIYMIVYRSSAGSLSDDLKLNNFVYRTSRVVGSVIAPLPAGPIS